MTDPDKPDLSALWPLLPPWIKWVAMCATGEWFGYMKKPKIEISAYYSFGTCFIPRKYAPRWRGYWRNSLTRRPKND